MEAYPKSSVWADEKILSVNSCLTPLKNEKKGWDKFVAKGSLLCKYYLLPDSNTVRSIDMLRYQVAVVHRQVQDLGDKITGRHRGDFDKAEAFEDVSDKVDKVTKNVYIGLNNLRQRYGLEAKSICGKMLKDLDALRQDLETVGEGKRPPFRDLGCILEASQMLGSKPMIYA